MLQLFRYLLRRWFVFARAVFDSGGGPELTGSGAKRQLLIFRPLFSIPGGAELRKIGGGN